PQVNFSGMPLSRVAAILSELSVEYDPERKGVNIVPLLPEDSDPRVNISLRNLNLDQILQFVTTQVNHKVSILEANNVVTIQPGSNLTQVELHAEARAKNTHQTPKREKQTREEPISTFSLNVSDVSFALAQAALENSRVPNPELIRSEEFLNSFDYGDPTPQPDEPVSLNWEMAEHPYAHGRQVVRFSLQTGAAGRSAGQSLNLNLLVDNSGSMQRPDRRAIMEQSLQSLKDKLQPNDQLNVVLFSRQPKLIANARTPHEQQVAVDLALDYRPEGGTNLEAGLDAAYANAQQNFDPAASNRVILMTDGAANLGEVNAPELAKKVIYNRKQGIALDAYGIGWDDYNDELLEEITRNGDGRYAFLNSAETAADDFAEKLAGSLRVAAADVKVQIVWNPGRVTAYRQVGYDLHQLKTEDFRDNTVDAAEIGEAESGTALYVVQLNEGEEAVGRLGTLNVRYRDPSTNTYKEQEWPLEMPRSIPSLEQASPSLRLATTSALFAERLARNPYAADVSFDELSKLSSDLPQAFPTQQRVVDLQNMIHNARILLGDAK
ncbi:MAG: YfbK domain-containing protein, partial [Coraliomargarita sp.]